jgi:Reverse transcriptase (RNA-dependent DNA polymerase)
VFASIGCRQNHTKQGRQNPEPPEQTVRQAGAVQRHEQPTEPREAGTTSQAQSVIPAEYRDLREVFEEQPASEALPAHKPWDLEIPLEEGRTPPYLPIYQLSPQEQETLRTYIDENLAKGYIRKSESPAGFPIIFVPKKDGSLRLCVDYRKLNEITVKNRYPLPLIQELKDQLQKAKWFTKLDVRDAYHRVRIKRGEE